MNAMRNKAANVSRVLVLSCVAFASAALLLPDVADAQRRGGGGARAGGGGMARSSVSGANRASQQASMSRGSRSGASAGTRPSSGARASTRPSPGASASTRPSTGTGNRVNTGDINSGNRVNSGDINNGNRVNNGNINTGNINTGDINIDRDVNVDVDHDGWGNWHDVDIEGGPGDWEIDVDHYHPIATAAAIATTAAIVGSYYYAVPVGCPLVYTYPQPYYYCGNTYYERRMQGDTVVYVVVSP